MFECYASCHLKISYIRKCLLIPRLIFLYFSLTIVQNIFKHQIISVNLCFLYNFNYVNFFKDLFIIICKYTVAVFRHTRRGSHILLWMVVSHHVVAGIWILDLRKSSRVLLPTEPSHQPPLHSFLIRLMLIWARSCSWGCCWQGGSREVRVGVVSLHCVKLSKNQFG